MAKSSLERLRFCNFKLKTLLDITQAINRNAPIDSLLNRFKKLLSQELNIGKFILFSNLDGQWRLWLDYGVTEQEYSSIDIEKDLLPFREIEITVGEDLGHLKSFDFIIPILKDTNVIAYVLIGDVDNEKIGLSPSIQHLQFIQTLTNIIMVAIQNRELIKKSFEQERIRKELEMAAKIQAMLVPSAESMPKLKNIKIHPFYMSHFEVGGDLYDVGYLGKNQIYICIADVSGKGMSAAMIMSNFQANLRALFNNYKNNSLKTIIKTLNDNVIKVSKGFHFVTMFLAKYNLRTGTFTYVNAGHLPPILYDYKSKRNIFLTEGCPGIGMLDEIPKINIKKIIIRNHAKLLCFTDGLSEYSIEGHSDYGHLVARRSMLRFDLNIKETINLIVDKLSLNKKNAKVFDDVTMLGVEFFPEED